MQRLLVDRVQLHVARAACDASARRRVTSEQLAKKPACAARVELARVEADQHGLLLSP